MSNAGPMMERSLAILHSDADIKYTVHNFNFQKPTSWIEQRDRAGG